MSEEDQMMRAIAMSLGQEVSMEQRSDSPEVGRLTHRHTNKAAFEMEYYDLYCLQHRNFRCLKRNLSENA